MLLRIFFLTALIIFPSCQNSHQTSRISSSVTAQNGVVVCVDQNAARVGLEILQKGGHAVDAAIATAFALAVTYPQAGNIGGGGFMMVRTSDGNVKAIDYREKAPHQAHARMFLNADGSEDTIASNYGYKVAGVPGTVRGLEKAWKLYGKLPWSELINPAIRLAEEGFILEAAEARRLSEFAPALKRFDETARMFFKADGSPYAEGERWIQKELAATLRAIADEGADVFYRGKIATQIADDMKAHGGLITHSDLAAYEAVVREPIRGNYRGYTIYSMPPPSSGGVTLIEMLNILENFTLHDDSISTRRVIETMRRSFLDRLVYLGDPDFSDIPVSALTDKVLARKLASWIDSARINAKIPALAMKQEPTETTHFSVIDKDGNCVSNTYTLEDNFGSKAMVTGLGFLLNNEMHDFDIFPDSNRFPCHGQKPNRIEPHKRMLSSMTPVIIIKDDKPFLITGSPGGKTIINTVLQIIIGMIDYGDSLRQAVDRPRLSHTWSPNVLSYEKDKLDETRRAFLVRNGYILSERPFIGDAHSIWIDPRTGYYHGEADQRIMGYAAGY